MADSFNPKKRVYGKRNFVDLLDNITPKVYQNEDISLSGQGLGNTSNIINSNLFLADSIATVLLSRQSHTQKSQAWGTSQASLRFSLNRIT